MSAANPRRVAPITIGPKGVERSLCVGVLRRHPLGWQLYTGLLPWLAVQSVCPFDPLGAVHIYVWLSFRGFAMLTRGYRVVRPPWGRRPRRHSAAKSRERRRPAACRCGTAVLIPHLYRHPAMLPAPQGSHYSITAGERSEPAEGAYLHHHRPQGGRTPYVRVLRRHPFGWQLSTACCRGWLCRAYARSTPLGPYIYMYGSSSAGSPCSPAEGRTSLSCHLA